MKAPYDEPLLTPEKVIVDLILLYENDEEEQKEMPFRCTVEIYNYEMSDLYTDEDGLPAVDVRYSKDDIMEAITEQIEFPEIDGYKFLEYMFDEKN